jgi:hypothetical protein
MPASLKAASTPPWAKKPGVQEFAASFFSDECSAAEAEKLPFVMDFNGRLASDSKPYYCAIDIRCSIKEPLET